MFNLLPGLPLDGGRALRAILWQRRKDILSATRTTMKLGVWLAYLLIAYGLLLVASAVRLREDCGRILWARAGCWFWAYS